MDKSTAGLIAAMGALVAAAPTQAATANPFTVDAALHASSYADLLAPIPNALALLKASSATRITPAAEGPASEDRPMVDEVQYHHHHHHHHHRRHHHHHHHNHY